MQQLAGAGEGCVGSSFVEMRDATSQARGTIGEGRWAWVSARRKQTICDAATRFPEGAIQGC